MRENGLVNRGRIRTWVAMVQHSWGLPEPSNLFGLCCCLGNQSFQHPSSLHLCIIYNVWMLLFFISSHLPQCILTTYIFFLVSFEVIIAWEILVNEKKEWILNPVMQIRHNISVVMISNNAVLMRSTMSLFLLTLQHKISSLTFDINLIPGRGFIVEDRYYTHKNNVS